jgi:hypothetical protein
MTAELDFSLRLMHYQDTRDDVESDKNADRIQPRGRELTQQIDHKGGLIARSGMYFELLPVDEETDPALAEAAKAAMRWELFHPLKRYQACRDRMVIGALATPAWAIEIGFNPAIGKYGEITFREKDPRTGPVWADGFLDPHDIECPWVMDWEWVPTVSLKAKKGPGWIKSALSELKGDPEPNKKHESQTRDVQRGSER